MSTSTVDRARMVRRRAKSLGLRMIQRGNVYELHDGAELAVNGSITAVETYVAERFVAEQPGPAQARIPAAWAPMISDYCLSLAAAGQAAQTIRLRRLALARMARGLGRPPRDVAAEHLVDWFGRQMHWSSAMRRNQRSAARGFFSWAYRTGRVPDYLGDSLPAVRETPPRPLPVTDDAWRHALSVADARVTVMLRLAAEAGLRRAEVAQVRTHDVLESGAGPQLLVHGKGAKDRLIPISESLAAVLRRGAAGHTPGMPANGWLFPTGLGGHLTADHVGGLVGGVLPDGWTMHKLRHRFATRAYRGTRNLRAVQTLLGHASIAMTERYTAVDDNEVRAAMMAAM